MRLTRLFKNTISAAFYRSVFKAVLIAMTLPFIASSIAFAAEIRVIDALDREIIITSSERIMTLGPDVSEIAFALGVGDRIVALDRSSRFPAETATKPNVGYRRSLSIEGILSLKPDLILTAEDIGPHDAVDIIKELSIPVVFLPEDNSPQGVGRKIEIIAAALGLYAEGQALKASVASDFENIKELANNIPEDKKKSVIFFHGLLKRSAAGRDTPPHEIITLAGGKNAFEAISGYKAASEEMILKMQPDTIMMLSDGKGGPTPEEVFSIPALKMTPAGSNESLVILEGPYMLGFGPRTAKAIKELAKVLYPESEISN